MLKTSITNLSLRGLTMVSKFILLLFIARYLSPEELGIWGLMNITLSISLLLVGLDFYVFNTREILAVDKTKYVVFIKNQLVFQLFAYLLFMPLLIGIFFVEVIPWQYAGWFYGLLILENFSQESIRLHIVLSRPTISSVILFLRSGAWVYAVIFFFYFEPDTRHLPMAWLGWIIGASASMILSFLSLRNLPWRIALQTPVDWAWVKKGLKVSLPLLCSTISFVGIQNLDRYFLKYYYGESAVGIYTFHYSIANLVNIVIYTGLIMILFPKLVSSFQQEDYVKYRAVMKKMTIGIIGGIFILVLLTLVFINPVLQIMNKQIYTENLDILFLLLINVCLLVVAYIPHYALFVRKLDRSIIISNVCALVVAVCANFLLVPRFGLTGAAYATMTAMATMFIMKVIMVNAASTGCSPGRIKGLSQILFSEKGKV
ncbi:MAG: polysaccharide biosynthesis C-terminal domain-containing protein [candidate division Zixibacteria bacterium]|nr:polysaccharide biosynthesis C-terminal domain-containing protein [candidate division Zixibacteria bacterium]